MTMYYRQELEGPIGDDVFYIDGGSITGAAPMALLNAKDGEISNALR